MILYLNWNFSTYASSHVFDIIKPRVSNKSIRFSKRLCHVFRYICGFMATLHKKILNWLYCRRTPISQKRVIEFDLSKQNRDELIVVPSARGRLFKLCLAKGFSRKVRYKLLNMNCWIQKATYSCIKITKTWIQIFCQNWNVFFSNISNQMIS